MADAWGTIPSIAAERVRIAHADRQDALVQSEVRRLSALTEVRNAACDADLDPLFVRYGCHD